MTDAATARSYGRVFDAVAGEYDRNRPGYPEELVAHACELAGLKAGDPVLELGCGTGQLTTRLVARGLHVTAVEPGENLIALAAQNLKDGRAQVNFVNARLEDADLPRDRFDAAFAASSFHWVDPDIGWRAVAEALKPHATFALIGYLGIDEEYSASDQAAMMASLRRHAPELAAEWPRYRSLDATLTGVEARRANLSEVWSWLGSHDLARDHAASLFDDVQIAAVPVRHEHTAGEINGLLGTMSFWGRLSPQQRDALAADNRALHERLGRPIRSSTVAVAVTASCRAGL